MLGRLIQSGGGTPGGSNQQVQYNNSGTFGGTDVIRSDGSKLAFFDAALSLQQVLISDPSGGATVDTEARATINLLIDTLQAYGLLPTIQPYLLQENGDFLLQENGDKVIL